LLKLLFPEFTELEKFVDHDLIHMMLDHEKQIAILKHVIESEVWEHIKEKYETHD